MSEAQVYVPDADAAWARASVLSAVGGTVYEVRIDGVDDNDESGQSDWGAGEVRRVDLAGPEFGVKRKGAAVESSLPLQNLGLPDDGVEDMTRLDYLHEPAILFNLRRRFFRAMPYTYTGEIVIACNPYRWLDLYGEERRKQYAGMVRGERSRLPPHVYSTSAVAFAGLSKDRENQSILVSGESGAGKTETVKILMGHLAVASSAVYGDEGGGGVAAGGGEGGGGNDDVIRKIIESNPLLESFGNAQTTRNDNSSRFGKFTQLQFDGGFRMSGSGCTTYLLEKSRVVGHEPGERAYHVFYQILAAPEEAKARLGLAGKLALDFRYLTADGTEADSVIEGRTDAQRYDMTTAALGLIGVREEETLALFRALAGVLFLGQVDFTKRGGDEDKSEVVGQEALMPPSTLLGFDGQGQEAGAAAAAAATPGAALDSSLCYRTIRARNDVLRADSSPAQAADARDAMAKAIYGGLFEWLVERINRSTASSAPGADGPGGAGAGAKTRHAGEALAPGGTVALLDIFGFESFKVNRFEQLCINYANEKLQQKFTQDVFKNVQAEYEEEGIPWSHVDFSDNAEVLGLVESRMGIIAVLNEECVRPRGGDNSFVSKLSTLHADHSAFARAKLAGPFEFSVRHYAGEVLYHAEGFLDKNRDSVGEACRDLLAKSSVPLIAKVFAPDPGSAEGNSGGGGGASRKKASMATNTLATKFKGSLTTLMDTIGLTSVQYVRCIKPNAAKLPGRMENAKVAEQLRCAGVVEAIRISRAAYPNRMARTDFNKRFALLGTGVSRGEGDMAICKSLLGKLLPRGEGAPLRYEMGRSKVYFRKGALEHLESLRLEERSSRVTVLQAVARMFPRKKRYRDLREGAVRAQAEWRRVAERRRFLTARGRVIRAQSCWRRVKAAKVVLAMRRHRAASCLQAYRRMLVARRRFAAMQGAAVAVQTFVRGAQARRNFAVLVVEHREAAKLENQILALQRKLDEERKARLKMEEDHKQFALEAAASRQQHQQQHQQQQQQQSAASSKPALQLPGPLSPEEAAKMAQQARGGPSPATDGGGGVLDMVGDAPKLSSIPGRSGDGGKSFPTGSAASGGGGGGAGVAAAAAAGAGSFMKGAMGFFSPTTLARHKKQLEAEDRQRMEASLDIMGESSEIIKALNTQVDKLRKDNDNLKKSNESLRRDRQYEKQKALSSYEASGMSYHALNQTVKALSSSKKKLTAEVKHLETAHAEDSKAMLEIIQSKGEELLRREEEGKTMRLLYESEVTKGKNRQHKMEAMLRLLAETSAPIEDAEKDELLHHMSSMYKECVLEDPNVVDEVDTMMSSMGMGQVSAKATSALSSAKAWFTGRKSTDLFI